jgi:hypothetical protein
LVLTTLLRHGNWDSVNQSVFWNDSDDTVLPRSFYLNSKPMWWGSMQWPAIGPDVSPNCSGVQVRDNEEA